MAQPATSKVRTVWLQPQPPLARFCQRSIFLLIAAVVVFVPLTFHLPRPWSLAVIHLAVGCAAALWLVRLLSVREAPVLFSALGPPLLMMATYVIVSYYAALVEPVARPQMLTAMAATLFFFLLLNNVNHRWQLSLLVWSVAILGALVSVYELGQIARSGHWLWNPSRREVWEAASFSPLVSPSHLAAYLQLAFPLAAGNFFFSRRLPKQKVMLLIACVLMAMGLIFSPRAWVGALAGVLILTLYVLRKRGTRLRWAVVGLIAAGVLAIIALVIVQSQREQMHEDVEEAPHGVSPSLMADVHRLPEWWTHLVSLASKNNLWLGGGPGMYPWLYPSHRSLQGRPQYASNEFLSLFADYGLIGVALGLWTVGMFFFEGYKILTLRADRYSAATPSNRYAFAVGGLAGCVALALHSLFDTNLHSPANLFTLIAIVAGVMTCGVHARDEDIETSRSGEYCALRLKGLNKALLTGALLGALLLYGWRLKREYPSALIVMSAQQQQAQLHWTAAETLYLRALNFDRRNFEAASGLGDIYMARATWNARGRDALCDEAFRWYQRALTLNPFAADLQIKCARLYDLLGKRKQALELYQRCIEIDPSNASYYSQLGLHYLRWGDQDKAAESFHRAAKLDNTDPLPQQQLKQLGEADS